MGSVRLCLSTVKHHRYMLFPALFLFAKNEKKVHLMLASFIMQIKTASYVRTTFPLYSLYTSEQKLISPILSSSKVTIRLMGHTVMSQGWPLKLLEYSN